MPSRPAPAGPRPAATAASALAFGAVALTAGAATLVGPAAVAQTAPVVRFVEGTVFAQPDARVDLVVEAVDVEDLAGFQVTVGWDPRIVELVDVEVLEDFLTATGRTLDYTPPVITDDAVTLAAYTVPPQGVPVPGATGAGEILRVGLRTLRGGRSDVALRDVLLVNTLNDPVLPDLESGQVVVVDPDGFDAFAYMPFGERP
jgi:hypothetical protein